MYRLLLIFLFFSGALSAQDAAHDYLRSKRIITLDGNVPFRENGKWGFRDWQDSVIVPAVYDSIGHDGYRIPGSMIIAYSGQTITVYNASLKKVYEGALADLTVPRKHTAFPDAGEISLREYLEWKKGSSYRPLWHRYAAKEIGLYGTSADTLCFQYHRDSVIVVVQYGVDRSDLVIGKKGTCWVAPPYFLYFQMDSAVTYINLETEQEQQFGETVPVFFHCEGKLYSITPEGNSDWYYEDASGEVGIQKYDRYVLREGDKVLRTYQGPVTWRNGILIEACYDPVSKIHRGSNAHFFPICEAVGGGEFDRFEFNDNGFTTFVKGKEIVLCSAYPRLLFAGEAESQVSYYFMPEDTLIEIHTPAGTQLVTAGGKVLGNFADTAFIQVSGSHCLKGFAAPYDVDDVFHVAYRPETRTLKVLNYKELMELAPGRLLVKDDSGYKLIDDSDKVLGTIPAENAEWFPGDEGGLIIAREQETDPQLRRRKGRFVRKKLRKDETLLAADKQPWKYAYYDEHLNPVKLPENLLLTRMPYSLKTIRFEALANPGYYGMIDVRGNVLIPNVYRAIVFDEFSGCFMVLDEKWEVDYVRVAKR